MKIENLAVLVPNLGCNKDCQYCVSKMTWKPQPNMIKLLRNVTKVKKFIDNCNVKSVLISSNGEPLYNLESIKNVYQIGELFNEYSLGLQTNGLLLCENVIKKLASKGFDVVSISIDSRVDLLYIKETIKIINDYNMISRIVFNVVNSLTDSFYSLIDSAKEYEIKQLLFRQITVPNNCLCNKTRCYIENSTNNDHYLYYLNSLNRYKKELIRTTNDGINIWDIDGISVLMSPICIQENNDSSNIRSLILHENGHLYTSWNKESSILF